uniref:Pkinase_fungal domain-containing protein n=1 Tax=Caenorhabditis tropicalis TaxID=1561998 RepID=A0A1I7TSZ3_9PELO
MLHETGMMHVRRHQNQVNLPRRLRSAPLSMEIQMKATKAFCDTVCRFLTGRSNMEVYKWNFILTGGYVKTFVPPNDEAGGERPDVVQGNVQPENAEPLDDHIPERSEEDSEENDVVLDFDRSNESPDTVATERASPAREADSPVFAPASSDSSESSSPIHRPQSPVHRSFSPIPSAPVPEVRAPTSSAASQPLSTSRTRPQKNYEHYENPTHAIITVTTLLSLLFHFLFHPYGLPHPPLMNHKRHNQPKVRH